MWNNLPHTVFDTGMQDGTGVCGVAKAIINNFVFPTWVCAAGFNNDNNYEFDSNDMS